MNLTSTMTKTIATITVKNTTTVTTTTLKNTTTVISSSYICKQFKDFSSYFSKFLDEYFIEVDCNIALPYELNGHHGDVYSTGEIDTESVLKDIKENDF